MTEIDEAVADVQSRRPRLCEVIAGCLVGWPFDIPPIVYQALIVKVDEYLSAGEESGEEARSAMRCTCDYGGMDPLLHAYDCPVYLRAVRDYRTDADSSRPSGEPTPLLSVKEVGLVSTGHRAVQSAPPEVIRDLLNPRPSGEIPEAAVTTTVRWLAVLAGDIDYDDRRLARLIIASLIEQGWTPPGGTE